MKHLIFNYWKKIIIIIIIIINILIEYYKYKYYHQRRNNNNLDISNAYNQGYHPKVLFFKNKWNKYKYWITYTPYPLADKTKENPFLKASIDLIHWITPKGLKNPLDIPIISDNQHYNSDSHILYNNNTNEIEIFWRYVNIKDNEVTIYVRKSKDGINLSEKEIFIKSNNRKIQDYVSPCIIYENNIYRIWYVHRQKIFYLEKNGENFTKPRVLNITYKNNYHTWHIDLIFNIEKKIYELIACAYINIHNRRIMPIFYLNSEDNRVWSIPKIILKPPIKLKFNYQGLYRNSIVYEKGIYYIFYSAHDHNSNVGIGLMYGKNLLKLKFYY